MSASTHDIKRNAFMLEGKFAKKGYDWWWHSFTAINRITKEEKPFFIEFFTMNPALAKEEPILGQLKQGLPSYVMVKGGCWKDTPTQLHRFYSYKDVTIDKGVPFKVDAGDCYLDETYTKGVITISEEEAKAHPEWMCDSGSMKWELKIKKLIPFNVGYGASSFFRKIKAFEMYWHAEGMKSTFEGTIEFNGEIYDVLPESCNGYADKNWGSNFTSPWVWLSSNDITSRITGKKLENTVFDIGGGRPKIFFVALDRKLLGSFHYEGKDYEFNFSKFWTGSKTEFDCKESDTQIIWHVVQTNNKAKLETDITCEKKDMLLVNYESPDGLKRHNRLWNGGNGVGRMKLYEKVGSTWKLIDDMDVQRIGCEYGEYD
ncbi:MAG: hypothetical protein HUJ56_04240 [Erysipelotrichaceae bacterium]|nr:hypothetical protein [Erysipelotrichaceae bacterium]